MFFNKVKAKNKFDKWIGEYHKPLYKHALWMTGDKDLAEDLVQETYYQAWKSIKGLRDESLALAWFLSILRRVIYREQRHKYKQVATIEHLQNIENASPSQVSDAFNMMHLYELFNQLPVTHRETFLLRVLHDFTYEEISKQLEIPVGTVMSRISRTRELLKNSNQDDSNVIPLNRVKRSQEQ